MRDVLCASYVSGVFVTDNNILAYVTHVCNLYAQYVTAIVMSWSPWGM